MANNELREIRKRVNNNINPYKENDKTTIEDVLDTVNSNCRGSCTSTCYGCVSVCSGNCGGTCYGGCSNTCVGSCAIGCISCTGEGGVAKPCLSDTDKIIKEPIDTLTFDESHVTLINGKPINDNKNEGFTRKLLRKFKKQKIEDTWRTN
jgi:hypothetical protein